jgi:beta-glucosidase-like glycosyl hydrolase
VRGEQGSNKVEQRVDSILSQMTLDEKLSYIGGTSTATTYGVFNIRGIPRLGLPEIDMCNGPLGIQSLIGQDSTRYPAGLALASTWNRDRALARGRQMGRDARFSSVMLTLSGKLPVTLEKHLQDNPLKLGFVTEAEFDRVVDPAKMVKPYVAGNIGA